MRFISALLVLCLSAAANAGFLGGLRQDQSLLTTDGGKVPGNSPLTYCAPNEAALLDIYYVNLSPNPPEKGKNLTIEGSGFLHQDITEGAYVNLVVKYGYITIIKTKLDACKELPKIGMECPIKKGEINIKKEVAIPAVVPKGTYDAQADAYTADDKSVTCLKATVDFP